ncbi:MAG: alanine dehydrogenase [Solirubrobacteraceae bacterium]
MVAPRRTSRVGIPKEIKRDEHRVALSPAGVRELVEGGHEVFVQSGAGTGAGIADAAYAAQGASVLALAEEVFARADLIVKVKEPQPTEVALLREQHTLFTYLHLAPDRELTDGLIGSGATCIAYETVRDERGRLPLLAPMSEVAGKLAAHAGSAALQKAHGGRGAMLGRLPGVAPAKAMIVGGGTVGLAAARIAVGMEADVCVLDRDVDRLRELELLFGSSAATCFSTAVAIEERLPDVDVVIGAVLVAGARAPHVIGRDQLALMKRGAVLVDVAIDQGGCFATSKPTTHSDPTYVVDGVVHYCVANMPGAVPVSAARALENATLPYVLRLADLGARDALAADPGFLEGLSVCDGALTSAPVAADQGRAHVEPADALGIAGTSPLVGG